MANHKNGEYVTKKELKEALRDAFDEFAYKFIMPLHNDVAELKKDIAILKKDIAEIKKDIAEIKKDVAELKKDMKEVKSHLRKHHSRISVIEEKTLYGD